jgi:uncharacterized protein (TIGR00369 family)
MSGDGFTGTIGLEVVRSDDGDEAEAAIDAGDGHLNPHGTVHGGVIATLVDSAMGAAVATGDVAPVTIDLTVTYLEPAGPGRLVARARVRRRGKRITIVEADVADADDEAVAHAVATFTTID